MSDSKSTFGARCKTQNVTLDNEGVLGERIAHLRKERGGIKGAFTAKHKELKRLIAEGADCQEIENKLCDLSQAFKEFDRKNSQYVDLIKEDSDAVTGAESYRHEVSTAFQEIQQETNTYIKHSAKHSKSDTQASDDVTPGDSVSQVDSKASTSSLRLKARAKKASLLAKARTLKRQQELKRKQIELQQEEESLALEGQIAEVEAAEQVYAEYESDSGKAHSKASGRKSEIKSEAKLPNVSRLNPLAEPWDKSSEFEKHQYSGQTEPETCTDNQLIFQSIAQQQRILFEMQRKMDSLCVDQQTNLAHGINTPSVTHAPPIDNLSHKIPDNNLRASHMPEDDKFLRLQRTMVTAMQLPKSEIAVFDGDPLKYWIFIRGFENAVDNTDLSESGKLNHLIQCCSGKAREVIECCAIMDQQVGYSQARRLLRDRFGNQFSIAKAWISKITEGQVIRPNDVAALRKFADDVRSCVVTMAAMGRLGEVDNQIRMVKIVEKLPVFHQGKWRSNAVKMLRDEGKYPDIEELANFIEIAAEEANDPVFGGPLGQFCEKRKLHDNVKFDKARGASFNVQVSEKGSKQTQQKVRAQSSLVCHHCSGDHALVKCEQFQKLSPENRRDVVRNKKLCFNCFSAQHWSDKCTKPSRCGVDGCRLGHSRLLHLSEKTGKKTPEAVHNGHVKIENASFPASGAGAVPVALPVVTVFVQDSHKNWVQTCALLDSGSTNTFCSEDLLDKLNIKGTKSDLTLTTLQSQNNRTGVEMVSLQVSDKAGRNHVDLPRVFAISNFPDLKSNDYNSKNLAQWTHLQDVNLPQTENSKVTLLIGQDVPEVMAPLEIRSGKPGEPYATNTMFGWTLNGPLNLPLHNSAVSNFITADRALSDQVERFWKIEACNQPAENGPISANDQKVLNLWETTTKRVDGHYEMKIPFRNVHPNLPNNYCIAESRLGGLGRKLNRDPELLNRYQKEISGLISKGYAEHVPENEVNKPGGKTWYIPHHGVSSASKPDKLRIVFDCAATYSGVSLNSEVLQGPDLTNKLLGVLLRFRENDIAVVGDVESMFHQVRVAPEDRDALRFLWWKYGDPSETPEVFRMTVHLFGGVWSPSCANFALKLAAKDSATDFPEQISETVHKNFYVDDCLKSTPTTVQAVEVVRDLSSILEKGGFKITKWMSSSRAVLQSIPKERKAEAVRDLDIDKSLLPVDRALGVKWDTDKDQFGYKINPKEKPHTRRGLISTISSIYDPLGFICPYVLQAKKIFQQETKRRKGWDSPLEGINLQSWFKWLQDLQKVEKFWINRCLIPRTLQGNTSHQLHHFSDACQDGYGTVSYLRISDTTGVVHCSLVLAKARLAPIKTLSIPRLELSAATLAAKMDTVLGQELDVCIEESVFWTDSMIVLQYVKNEDKRFHTFVANRVAQIHSSSSPDQWRYVTSSENPADDASRGLTADALLESDRWKDGPAFLRKDQSQWPEQLSYSELPQQDMEVKRETKVYVTANSDATHLNATSTHPVTRLLERYSSWHQAKRGVAWILRLRQILRDRVRGKSSVYPDRPTVSDMKASETAILKFIQEQAFAKELKDLQSLQFVRKSSALFQLEPKQDDNGLLCVGGRLQRSPISTQAKHPVIVPADNHVSMLLTRYYHELSGHSGKEHVLSQIRQKFWILKARRLVRRVLKDCVHCKRCYGKPDPQRMSDLPQDRVTPGNPSFTFVGVDCFGPFLIKRARSQIKRYGCIFTCLATRAIHIEKLDSMDTDSFVNALKRFQSRRGTPELIRSDNGSNFVAGEKELREGIRRWNQQAIGEHLKQKNVVWEFNPPAASHMGGAWERQIRTVRKVLTALMSKEHSLDDESLSTLFCVVEAIVNSRPLTVVSDDCKDPEPLTPNHLLLMRSVPQLPSGVFTEQDKYRKRWRQVQALASGFWKRWIREYLPSIQLRQKWMVPKRNLKIGDIVLITDVSVPRGVWPMGRITKIHSGPDGLVRSVEVKTKSSVLVRPVHKLCLLECANV